MFPSSFNASCTKLNQVPSLYCYIIYVHLFSLGNKTRCYNTNQTSFLQIALIPPVSLSLSFTFSSTSSLHVVSDILIPVQQFRKRAHRTLLCNIGSFLHGMHNSSSCIPIPKLFPNGGGLLCLGCCLSSSRLRLGELLFHNICRRKS